MGIFLFTYNTLLTVHSLLTIVAVLLQIVNDCNEGARKMERMEEICVLQTQIEFKTKVRKHLHIK